MMDLVRFVLVLLLLTLLVFVQGTRFLDFGGVNPDLILIFSLGLIFDPSLRKQIHFNYFLTLLAFSFFVGSFLFDFWIIPWLTLAVIVAGSYFAKKYLTGRPFLDFLAMIAGDTVLLYVLLKILSSGALRWDLILEEVIYNLVLGVIFWYFLRILEKRHAQYYNN